MSFHYIRGRRKRSEKRREKLKKQGQKCARWKMAACNFLIASRYKIQDFCRGYFVRRERKKSGTLPLNEYGWHFEDEHLAERHFAFMLKVQILIKKPENTIFALKDCFSFLFSI